MREASRNVCSATDQALEVFLVVVYPYFQLQLRSKSNTDVSAMDIRNHLAQLDLINNYIMETEGEELSACKY